MYRNFWNDFLFKSLYNDQFTLFVTGISKKIFTVYYKRFLLIFHQDKKKSIQTLLQWILHFPFSLFTNSKTNLEKNIYIKKQTNELAQTQKNIQKPIKAIKNLGNCSSLILTVIGYFFLSIRISSKFIKIRTLHCQSWLWVSRISPCNVEQIYPLAGSKSMVHIWKRSACILINMHLHIYAYLYCIQMDTLRN